MCRQTADVSHVDVVQFVFADGFLPPISKKSGDFVQQVFQSETNGVPTEVQLPVQRQLETQNGLDLQLQLQSQLFKEFPGLKYNQDAVDKFPDMWLTSDWTIFACCFSGIMRRFWRSFWKWFLALVVIFSFVVRPYGVFASKQNNFACHELQLNPILCQLQRSTADFWLLDSGAAAMVVSWETYERFKEQGCATEIAPCAQSFYAANGSAVVVKGETQLNGYF